MSKVSELLGLDDKIKKVVEMVLDDRVKHFTKTWEKAIVFNQNKYDDIYKNMKEIEIFKYRLIEIETRMSNLETFVRLERKREGE